jgi:hypothetical protein
MVNALSVAAHGVAATDTDFFRIRREKLEPRPSVAHKRSVRHAGALVESYWSKLRQAERERGAGSQRIHNERHWNTRKRGRGLGVGLA